MDRMLLVYVLLAGTVASGSLLIEDSPYDSNVHVERAPFAGATPADLDGDAARQYVSRFEERRLENDLLRSRGLVLDRGDRLVTRCMARSVKQIGPGAFRVDLRCRGDVVDTNRPIQPDGFDYTVAYRVSLDDVRQVAIDGFPFATRDSLEPGTPPGNLA